MDSIPTVLPGVVAVSVLFGTTSMLAVTVTFEKKNRSFDRLLLAPIPLELLMLAKTGGAILFGSANACVPIILASFLTDLSHIRWSVVLPAILLIAIVSTFQGLFIAVSVSEVFEAQTFSNFFRFPMVFLCGLFFPIASLPLFLRPLSYLLPLTYGADILHGAIHGQNVLPLGVDFLMISLFGITLFWISMRNIHKKWIA
jgi:ABC-2 type transport system permease protein